MESVFDKKMVREIYEDDHELFQEIIEMLIERLPGDMDKLHQAVENQQTEDVRKTAHQIRSSLVTAAASPAARLAGEVEDAAVAGKTSEYTGAFSAFSFEIKRLITYAETREWLSYFV